MGTQNPSQPTLPQPAKTEPVSPKAPETNSKKSIFGTNSLIFKNREIQKQKLKKIYELEKKAQVFMEIDDPMVKAHEEIHQN